MKLNFANLIIVFLIVTMNIPTNSVSLVIQDQSTSSADTIESRVTSDSENPEDNIIIKQSLTWIDQTFIPAGMYSSDVEGVAAVYVGTVYHVLFYIGGSVSFDKYTVFYTNFSNTVWSTPVAIFNGSEPDGAGGLHGEIESIALEFDTTSLTFQIAINTWNPLGHNRVLYLETSSLSSVTTLDFGLLLLTKNDF